MSPLISDDREIQRDAEPDIKITDVDNNFEDLENVVLIKRALVGRTYLKMRFQ